MQQLTFEARSTKFTLADDVHVVAGSLARVLRGTKHLFGHHPQHSHSAVEHQSSHADAAHYSNVVLPAFEDVHVTISPTFRMHRTDARREWQQLRVQPTLASLASFAHALTVVNGDASACTGHARAWKVAGLHTFVHPLLTAACSRSRRASMRMRVQAAQLWCSTLRQVGVVMHLFVTEW